MANQNSAGRRNMTVQEKKDLCTVCCVCSGAFAARCACRLSDVDAFGLLHSTCH